MEIYLVALIILAGLGISGIITGVSNDAVNFLNSSIGSRVAPRYVAMTIASLGMLVGVTFSSGMMEVARKGIFHPQFFTMPELLPMFVGVMLANILLLDLYNTFGLPTSTTVAIVFGLLGGSVALSYIKAHQAAGGDYGSLLKYINAGNSLAIVSGILISVAIAFVFGAIIQFFSRLLFTFDYRQRLRRYGAIWGGLALSFITYFIIIKGANGFTFITPGTLSRIQTHTGLILLLSFLVCAVILQLILLFTKINILKPIILIGTFALAMAFAANDLVNFIGVPLAGWNAYRAAEASSSPLTVTMGALQEGIPASTFILLAAGLIMALTLWFSRKARTVTETEINLGRQDEGYERFGSSLLARTVVRMVSSLGEGIKKLIPWPLKIQLDKRLDPARCGALSAAAEDDAPSFDLVRAAVNLVVSSALISFGTSLKLPLSTTYVTFMVAMGSSFSDRAWDRDSAVYRVTGVLTVIGGWFLTAIMVFTVSLVFTFAIYYSGALAVLIISGLGLFVIIRNHHLHKKRKKAVEDVEIFNLKKVKDDKYAIETTFEHAGIFLQAIAINLGLCYEGLATQNRRLLKSVKSEIAKIQSWADIIVANIFKTLRLLDQEEIATTHKYAQSIDVLQELAECHRDIISRAYDHIDNHHKPMLPIQLEEIKQVKDCILNLLEKTSDALMKKQIPDFEAINRDKQKLHRLITELNKNQVRRIQDNISKTRLSILFYGFSRDSRIIAERISDLLKIFRESFPLNESLPLNKELPPENSE